MGEWSDAIEDGVICPRCFSVLVGSVTPCWPVVESSRRRVRPLSDEERKQAREAANRDADHRLERKQRSEWEAERARILRTHRDAS